MTNSTDQFWSADGVSLQTLAWNISTWGGDRQAPPPLRGDNITIPYATGQTWYRKIPDSRSITLNMWVEGCNSDGSIPEERNRRKTFEDNFAMLRRLLWNPYTQFNLTKQLRIPGTDTIVPVTARAQFQDGFQPQMYGTHMGQFSVTLFLADPYFYGDPITVPMNQDFTCLGDARTEDIYMELGGGATLLNTLSNVSVTNTGSSKLAMHVRKFTAATMDAAATPSAGLITHQNSIHWMTLDPGTQHLQGPSDLYMTYRPRWI